MIKFTFVVPIYPVRVKVLVGSHIEVTPILVKQGLMPPSPDDAGSVFAQGGVITLWIPHPPTTPSHQDVFNHEVFHLAERILAWVGVKHDESSSEAWSYLIGYLTKRILKGIQSKTNKPKRKRKAS